MIKEIIERKLNAEFSPVFLDIQDDSDKHKHHSGWKEGGETHFTLIVVSNSFETKSKVERHKSIYKVLSSELKSHIHALSINAMTESEYARLL